MGTAVINHNQVLAMPGMPLHVNIATIGYSELVIFFYTVF